VAQVSGVLNGAFDGLQGLGPTVEQVMRKNSDRRSTPGEGLESLVVVPFLLLVVGVPPLAVQVDGDDIVDERVELA
jgi:hypothetical protein